VGKYESALYALLGCDADAVLESPLCGRWEDQCWALFRLALQARLDNIALLHRQQSLAETPEVAGPKDDSYDNQHITRITSLLNTGAGTDVYVCILLIYVCMYACLYVCMSVCLHVCIVCMYVCMSVCLYVCMYVCMYV
jgi:hypothetical protein